MGLASLDLTAILYLHWAGAGVQAEPVGDTEIARPLELEAGIGGKHQTLCR